MTTAHATRIFVISDLHLGGTPPAMMSFADILAGFIRGLPDRASQDEDIVLVLAGDVVDFLAIELDGQAEAEAFTSDPERAVEKLDLAVKRDAPVFAALRDHVAARHGLTILVGNHDIELALPTVQHALLRHLRCRPDAVHFVDDGRAWRFGPVLIEHGNRYDDANLNDWPALREIASCQSRGESEYPELVPSFGSQLVVETINKYKKTFKFIDTLQPEGPLVAYLIAAFEPGFVRRLPVLLQVWRGQARAGRNTLGLAPRRRAARSVLPEQTLDTSRLDELFGIGRRRRGPIVFREMLRPTDHSLTYFIEKNVPIPAWRLTLVQETLREMSWADRSLEPGGACGPQGAAAERLRRGTGARVVVMGHTHQARRYPLDTPLAEYINTGTWADLVRVPNEALATTDAGRADLEQWLRDLHAGRARALVPTWAELRVEADGALTVAELKREPRVVRARQT